jgi:cellulose synthase/poly-beta-1,6-N-acetylglucosamine synthase-like glycosyltransferase
MRQLGMPCHLTGSGMAFTWEQIRRAPEQHGNLVEDLVIGLELAIAGFPPLFVPEVLVESELPATNRAATSQRRRWEHGQLTTLRTLGPRLLREAVRQRRPSLAALAADLAVPPLALLIVILGVMGLIAGSAAFAGASTAALKITVIALLLVTLATVLAWVRFGRGRVPILALVLAPVYLAWKLPLYAAFFFRRRQKEWVRTQRGSTSADSDTKGTPE